jgi:hypothetical protein
MQRTRSAVVFVAALLTFTHTAAAQTFPVEDPVIERMWQEGMVNSQAYSLSQVLLDSLGPRLTGTPAQKAAQDWVVMKYQSWGIDARNEQYGTWLSWERGITHIDLITPRVRSLEGMIKAWSPGTKGKVRSDIVILPDVTDSAAFAAWLPQVKKKFVLLRASVASKG